MSFRLEPEIRQYLDSQRGHHADFSSPEQLHDSVATAFVEDPVLAFMLRFDSLLGFHRGVVTCLATVRRNIHHYELLYLQRFKQIAEPAVRHPKNREQILLYLDPKALRCGQQVMVKLETRDSVSEPQQLLRECSVLRASSARDPALFPRAYLFGCLGDRCWRVASSDDADRRLLVIYRQHFLLCQYVEDSLQGVIDSNRRNGRCLDTSGARRLGRDMLLRLRHLHCLGWTHGNLRPACFLLSGGRLDEILLSDFTSAEPLRQDCLIFEQREGVGGQQQLRDPVYSSARFPVAGGQQVFADLESLVYILCAAVSPTQLPWEQEHQHQASSRRDSEKLAFWRFVETAAAAAAAADQSEAEAGNLENPANVFFLFNCQSDQEVRSHPVYKLATAVTGLFKDWTAANTEDPGAGQHYPDYTTLLASLNDHDDALKKAQKIVDS